MSIQSNPVLYRYPGVTVMFQGIEYVIVKSNPKNYVIATREGKQYRLNKTAAMTTTGTDIAWLNEVVKATVERKIASTGLDATDENVGITPEGFPRFRAGQEVRITGRGAGRFEGKTGIIGRVNKTRYAVVVTGIGQVNVPFAMTVKAHTTAPGANSLTVDQHPLVGVEFRTVIGDEKVLFKVHVVEGKVLTAIGQKDDMVLPDGRTFPSEYEGQERDFLTADVQAIVNFEKAWAGLAAKQGN